MNHFSLLIKPVSGDCNQDCTYCFYLNRSRLYPGQRRRMTVKILKRIISSYLQTPQSQYVFTWQGGEPTLMGLDFYKQAVKHQQEYVQFASPGSTIANGLQTNALLIDRNFAEFFARNHFLLGVSLDGPANIHNRYRIYKNRTGSYDDVIKGINWLTKSGVEFNILTLVSQANVKKGKEVYRFLCEKGFYYHQYIECVRYDDQGRLFPYAVSGEEWGNFLCEIFDEWIKSDIYKVSVRLFDAILFRIVEGRFTVCHMAPNCGQYVVVEHNGDIYPCDFYVRGELNIGNIEKGNWHDFIHSAVLTNFASQKNKCHEQCAYCQYQEFCHGDCLKNRLYNVSKSRQLSRLCVGWKIFYQHALPRFRAIAETIFQKNRAFLGKSILERASKSL